MGTQTLRQAAGLLASLLSGLGAGLLYDLLRPPRWQGRSAAALLLDALFCLVCGAAFFLLAMSFGDGRLGLAPLAAAWLGFLAYHRFLSPRLLPGFVKIYQNLDKIPRGIKKIRKKSDFSEKNT